MKNLTVTVNGVAYNVTVEENTNGAGSVPVNAPMPGTILDIKVKAGAAVKAGDVVMILEAMKMENEISAPQDGTIASIDVRKGDTVNSGDVLYTMG